MSRNETMTPWGEPPSAWTRAGRRVGTPVDAWAHAANTITHGRIARVRDQGLGHEREQPAVLEREQGRLMVLLIAMPAICSVRSTAAPAHQRIVRR